MMCYQEPPDPIQVKCPDCGEEQNIEQVDGSLWKCLDCDETFGDGQDDDGSDFFYEDFRS